MLAQLTGQTLGTVVKIQTFHLGVLFNGENCFFCLSYLGEEAHEKAAGDGSCTF